MLHQVLPLIVSELNAFLQKTTSTTEDIALLSDLVDQSGSQAFVGENKVVCTLISLEQERNIMKALPTDRVSLNAPVNFNVNVLFSCHFSGNYTEALRLLSLVIAFFQGKQVFTTANTPGMPEETPKVSLEFVETDLTAQGQMWGALGARLVPSVYMKLRMVTISQDQLLEEIPEITSADVVTNLES